MVARYLASVTLLERGRALDCLIAPVSRHSISYWVNGGGEPHEALGLRMAHTTLGGTPTRRRVARLAR